MKILKQIVFAFIATLFTLVTVEADAKAKTESKKIDSYEKLFSKKHNVIKGMFTLHLMEGKVYFEIPDSLLGRDMLLGSAISRTSDNRNGIAGRKPNDPIHFTFLKESNKIAMRLIDNVNIIEGLKRRDGAIFKLFKIECQNPDSTSYVVNVTDLFIADEEKLSPFYKYSQHSSSTKRTESFVKENSYIEDIKAFDDNVSVRSTLSYKFTLKGKGSKYEDVPFTSSVQRTILLLRKESNRARRTDSRVAIFPLEKKIFLDKYQGSREIFFANRWSVIPSDKDAYNRGELVKPTKQIIFYIDPAFPEKYREYIKEGVNQWNEPFAKIGFKDVIKAVDYPKNDPEFDPDNLKYSCVRYAPIAIQNAEGPSWLDPRSGEIINASVYLYHDVLELINNWLFVQTSQVDKRVRKVLIDEEVIGDALRYVVSHEVGHCLGFMHNMSGSATMPVDSLRSGTFTQKYGTTSSIMDYARFNYVAQPEDSLKNIRVSPPRFGEYDNFLVKWNYSYIDAKDSEEEYKVLSKWLHEASSNPILRYGKQQFGVLDPRSQTEDLGDDAIKASTYGIKNLKYILPRMDGWLAKDDPDYVHRKMIYSDIVSQYCVYIDHVFYSIGGVNLYEKHVGDSVDSYVAVPSNYQKEALQFVLNSLDDIEWLYPIEITAKYFIDNPYKDIVVKYIMDQIMTAPSRCEVASTLSKEPFTPLECMDIIFNKVWGDIKDGKAISPKYMKIQNLYLEYLTEKAGIPNFKAKSKSIMAYDEQGALYQENVILPGDNYTYVLRAKKILEKGTKNRDERTSAHCKSLLYRLERGL